MKLMTHLRALPLLFLSATLASGQDAVEVGDYVRPGTRVSVPSFRLSARPPAPTLILTEPFEETHRTELVQDLQVMDRLITQAISAVPRTRTTARSVLGLTVSEDQNRRIQFVQGFGAIYTYEMDGSLKSRPRPANDAKAERPNDEWEIARQQLFEPQNRLYTDLTGALLPMAVDGEMVAALEERISKALRKVNRIRHLSTDGGKDGQVTVVLRSRTDGSTITLTTSADRMAKEPEDAVQIFRYVDARRSGSANDIYFGGVPGTSSR